MKKVDKDLVNISVVHCTYNEAMFIRNLICQATFFGLVMRREKLEHPQTNRMIEEKRSTGKHCEKMLGGLSGSK